MDKKEEKLLTTKEAAALFNVGTGTIIYWVKHYGLPHIKHPGRYMFKKSELKKWEARRTVPLSA